MTWSTGPADAGVTISASGKTLWSASIAGASGAETTIVRIRGSGILLLKTTAAGGDGFAVGLGIGLVENNAFAAGIASLPGPLGDTDWDGWMWHLVCHVQSVTATIADGVNAVGSICRYEVDTKAMRKFDGGAQTLIGVIEVTELGTASMENNVSTRILEKV